MPFCIVWVENFDEITLSCTVKKIEANFCFSIFGKNLKTQNGRHFWEEENFLIIAKSTFLRYPVGRKFHRNKANLCFSIFGNFFFNCQEYNAQIPCGSKILTKSLYLARLRR